MSQGASPARIPLTGNQKFQLLTGCVPLAAIVALVAVYVVSSFEGSLPVPSTLVSVIAFVIVLLFGYQAVQRIRDLVSGVALVADDVLIRSWHIRSNPNDIYGKFQRLGILQIRPKAAVAATDGALYRVAYSPASKVVWSLERIAM
jgi:hypothetical protein